MNIVADKELKKKVQLENRKNRKGLYILWIVEKVLLVTFIAWIFVYPLYCILTGTLVSHVPGTGKTSYFLVSMMTSITVGMGLTLVLFLWVVRKRVENLVVGGRVDEAIEIFDDKLFYTFRIEYQTPMEQRNLVVLDLNKLKNISYDEKLFRISIEGMMVEKMIKTSTNVQKIKVSEMENSELKLWDYYTPSLYEFLQSKMKCTIVK